MVFKRCKFLFYLILSVSCQITILGPEILVNEITQLYGSAKINYTFENEGIFPFGTSLEGRIYYPLYETEKKGCSLLESVLFFPNRNNIVLNTPILIFDGDDSCNIYAKANNAMNHGAKLLILNGPSQESSSQLGQSSVPTLSVSKTDGDMLIKYLENSNVTISVNFDIIPKRNKIDVMLWVEISDFYDGEKMQNIVKVLNYFNQEISNFTVYYLYKDYGYPMYNSIDCLYYGTYCKDRYYSNKRGDYISGKELLVEIIRQMCIFQLSPINKFLSYLENFKDNSVDYRNQIYENSGLSMEQIEHCVFYSFLYPQNPTSSENTILKNQKTQANAHNTFTITINNFFVRGTLNIINFKSALCSALLHKPEICHQDFPNLNSTELKNNTTESEQEKDSKKSTTDNAPEKESSDNNNNEETEKNTTGKEKDNYEKPEKIKTDGEKNYIDQESGKDKGTNNTQNEMKNNTEDEIKNNTQNEIKNNTENEIKKNTQNENNTRGIDSETHSNDELSEKPISENDKEKNQNNNNETNVGKNIGDVQCVCEYVERSKFLDFLIIFISVILATFMSVAVFFGIEQYRKKKIILESMNRHLQLADVSS